MLEKVKNLNENQILLLALLAHMTTAFFSEGFYHADEHYQIFEFASYKLGYIKGVDLPWEFSSKMRPWFLPSITTIIAKITNDPFTTSTLMRIIASSISFFASFYYFKKTKEDVRPELSRTYLFLSFFIWFFPYLHARVSAEVIAGALFSIAYIMIEKRSSYSRLFISGLIFGLSFWIRFQMGLALLGLALGYVINKKFNIKEILIALLGFKIAIMLNILIDTWGYSELTFAPWNYLNENIILGKSKRFGENPIFDYIKWIINKPSFPIGILIISSFLYQLRTKLKSPISIALIFFTVGHFLVSHKELRFFFPLIFLIPLMIVHFLESFKDKIIFYRKASNIFVSSNLFVLVIFMFNQASFQPSFFKFLRQNKDIKNYSIMGDLNPNHQAQLKNSFYYPNKPKDVKKEQSNFVFSNRVKYARRLKQDGCKTLFTSSKFKILFLESKLLKGKSKLVTFHDCKKS